jgi:hydroxyquinol 1,2-dioxygenase
MRDFDEHNITQAVIDRFAGTPDPRLKRIMTSLVSHLHDFIRDVEPTFAEWDSAIGFLTRTGQMCNDKRQEFILLSDTLGASMLVDAINHRLPEGATETTVLGPFFVQNAPKFENGADVSGGLKGELLFVEASVASAAGEPLADAVVDVWQSDDDGFYDVQRMDLSNAALRGQFRTDAAGKIHFRTIQPAAYPIPYDGPVGDMLKATNRHPWRPAHVHFMIAAPGYETLVTHVFSAGDEYLDSDAVFGVKNSLIRAFTHEQPGTLPDGTKTAAPWRHLTYDFGLKPLNGKPAAQGSAGQGRGGEQKND